MKFLYTGEFDISQLDTEDKVVDMLRIADEEYLEDVSTHTF